MNGVSLVALALVVLSGSALVREHPVTAGEPEVIVRLRHDAADAPLVVAHRGASADAPENTLAAFRAAKAAGAPVVEFDVYQTKDGQWVVLHDATCDRTTDAIAKLGHKQVRIDELSFAEARTLDAGAWRGAEFAGERLPTLEEAIRAILPAVPMIERKGGDAAAFVDELERIGVPERVLVQAFDWDWLAAVHRRAPQLAIAALGGGELTDARLADLARTGASIVHWDHSTLRLDDVADVHGKDLLLCVYTVDADLALVGAGEIGCDLVTTNRAARMSELRRSGLLSRPANVR